VFAIGAGSVGFIVLLANRLSVDLDKVTDVQGRADILSVLACSALLLNVLSESEIEAKERTAVPLMGYALPSPIIASIDGVGKDNNVNADVNGFMSGVQGRAVAWAIDTILRTTPATSVHVVRNVNEVVGRGGVVGLDDDRMSPTLTLGGDDIATNMGIFYKAISTGEEVYLPDFQILPGKVEFGGVLLPVNAQSLVILPFGERGRGKGSALIISTNQAKVLRMTDLQKIRVVASLLRRAL
jgi:hypothetical protein